MEKGKKRLEASSTAGPRGGPGTREALKIGKNSKGWERTRVWKSKKPKNQTTKALTWKFVFWGRASGKSISLPKRKYLGNGGGGRREKVKRGNAAPARGSHQSERSARSCNGTTRKR